MKIRVRVGGELYTAEVGDLDARPVMVEIDGERFEVWPEEPAEEGAGAPVQGEDAAGRAAHRLPVKRVPQAVPTGGPPPPAAPTSNGTSPAGEVRAPLPGVVLKVLVAAGDAVKPGQPLVVIEAMKMENTVRASRGGRVSALRVEPGRHVKHREVLLELAPEE